MAFGLGGVGAGSYIVLLRYPEGPRGSQEEQFWLYFALFWFLLGLLGPLEVLGGFIGTVLFLSYRLVTALSRLL